MKTTPSERVRQQWKHRREIGARAYDLACAVSAFICDARRRGDVSGTALEVLVSTLDAYNDAREGRSPRAPRGTG